jgi:multidrug efflux pump subunit AcrA (membrane-fusion protein)
MPKLWWTFVLLAPAILGGCAAHDESEAETKAESNEAFVTVKVEPARRGPISEAVDALGKIEALPEQLAILTPAVEGHVHELLVKQGDEVKKGQPIIELDKSVAQADLGEKVATRDGLKASLTLLRSVPRPEERRALEIAVDQAKVAVERAKATSDNLESLRSNNLTSTQQLFDAKKGFETAQFAQQSAEATLRAFVIGPRPEAVAEAEAKIKTAEGLVEFSKAHLEFHTIRSPIDGVLDSLTCHPGQTISIGAPIGEIVNTRRVYAAVWLSPRLARGISVGQSATVRHGDDDSKAARTEGLAGKVAFVGRISDPQTGNLPVRIMVENAPGQLALGQMVQVTINRGEKVDLLQVPVAAVLDMGEGQVLAVVRDGKSVVLHPELGTARDGWVAISGTDLKEGEPVIVEGGYNLPDGTHVKLAEPKAVVEAGDHK